jgi:hypothetical protein
MATLKLDAMVDAIQPPELEIGGAVYVGRLLSAVEAVAAVEWAKESPTTAAEAEVYVAKLAEVTGWPEMVLRPLRADVLAEVIAHFFACQGAATTPRPTAASPAPPTLTD